MAEFAVGANLPWLDYGQDFGASAWRPEGGLASPERRERLRVELGRLAASGASLVRLWLLADGRSGLVGGDEGGRSGSTLTCSPTSTRRCRSGRAGLRAHLVLTDFLWFSKARVVDGVRLGGGATRCAIRGSAKRCSSACSRRSPATADGRAEVAGWDLINEPEWATLGVGTIDPRASLSKAEMRAYLRELCALFHEHARQPLSVGLASPRWLSLVDGLPLDLVQLHWYETLDSLAVLARPVAPPAPGRAAPLLGEFPTRGASVPPARVLEIARAAGYSGALAWSALATDTATDKNACLSALCAFTQGAEAGRARA